MHAPTPKLCGRRGVAQRGRRTSASCAGRASYVADLRFADLLDVAFLRSPLAHARIRGVTKPTGAEAASSPPTIWPASQPIRAPSALPGFSVSEQPPLATGKVRHVGELIAMCVAPTRAEAEDLAELVELDLEELPAVADMLARARDGPRLHEHWRDNVLLTTLVRGRPRRLRAKAPIQRDAAPAHGAPAHGAAGRPRRASRAGIRGWGSWRCTPRRRCRTSSAAGLAECLGPGRGPGARDLARCRRRLRLQGHPAAGGDRAGLAGHAPGRPAGALDRGSVRAADRQRQLPRAPLRHHRLCRRRRHHPGRRLRRDRR